MSIIESPCTRQEALEILRQIAPSETPPAVLAERVKHLQTLSDADLTLLSQSEQTFAVVESNRRLVATLQKEARRTAYLTLLIAIVAVAILVVACLQIYAEYFRPD